MAKEAAPIRDFLVPQYVSFTVIRSVLQKFGLGAAGITYDEASGTISLLGKAGRIQDIKVLIEQLDKSAEGRQERLESQHAGHRGPGLAHLLALCAVFSRTFDGFC